MDGRSSEDPSIHPSILGSEGAAPPSVPPAPQITYDHSARQGNRGPLPTRKTPNLADAWTLQACVLDCS